MDRHIRLIIMLLLVNTVITAIYLFWGYIRKTENIQGRWMKAVVMLLCPYDNVGRVQLLACPWIVAFPASSTEIHRFRLLLCRVSDRQCSVRKVIDRCEDRFCLTHSLVVVLT